MHPFPSRFCSEALRGQFSRGGFHFLWQPESLGGLRPNPGVPGPTCTSGTRLCQEGSQCPVPRKAEANPCGFLGFITSSIAAALPTSARRPRMEPTARLPAVNEGLLSVSAKASSDCWGENGEVRDRSENQAHYPWHSHFSLSSPLSLPPALPPILTPSLPLQFSLGLDTSLL